MLGQLKMRETRFFVMWLKNAQKPTFITEKKNLSQHELIWTSTHHM